MRFDRNDTLTAGDPGAGFWPTVARRLHLKASSLGIDKQSCKGADRLSLRGSKIFPVDHLFSGVGSGPEPYETRMPVKMQGLFLRSVLAVRAVRNISSFGAHGEILEPSESSFRLAGQTQILRNCGGQTTWIMP
jgi:hypothetical protein